MMNTSHMEHRTHEVVGNPVDMWWNETRQHIDIHIALLRNIPSTLDLEVSAKALEQAYQYLIDAPYPDKAAETRAYLLCSVEQLKHALLAIQDGNRTAILEGYNMAYNRYITVCRLLLDRGIFEPVPRLRQSRIQ